MSLDQINLAAMGSSLHRMVADLYPVCRSITGNGLRHSLHYLQQCVPVALQEIPTGTHVFDWDIPKEWNIRDAYIKNAKGDRILDFQQSNLHVVNYSVPVHRKMPLQELRTHLHSLPDKPDWIPYRTSYYRETWGFCLSHRQLESLPDDTYEVCIDSTLEPGHLTYAEYRVPGASDQEVLISCHACHPSLCNDNLSGMAVAAQLARLLARHSLLRYSYRFLWLPGTIGAIAWLARNEVLLPRIQHGLVLSCLGDPGPFTYKKSRRGDAVIDRAVQHALRHSGHDYQCVPFTPYGYDERQYCSPGINLPVGCFMRTPHGQYPQYHTSADDLQLVRPEALAQSLQQLLRILEVLELNERFLNLNPKCEPQLGRRGLYRMMGGTRSESIEYALLWILNLSDGSQTLLDIAERSQLALPQLAQAARLLADQKLLRKVE